jgi:hypothetical protein
LTKYRLKFDTDPDLYLDKETYMMANKTHIALSILIHPQHDGRLWPKEFIDSEEKLLVDDIMEGLKPIVEELVQKAKPFRIHGPD